MLDANVLPSFSDRRELYLTLLTRSTELAISTHATVAAVCLFATTGAVLPAVVLITFGLVFS
jgi:hypothetical protein